MSSIGKALIYTDRNYEDELIKALGHGANMNNPEISYQQMENAFKNMKISLKND